MGFVCYLSGVLKYGIIDFALGENEVRKKEMGMRQEKDKKQTFERGSTNLTQRRVESIVIQTNSINAICSIA